MSKHWILAAMLLCACSGDDEEGEDTAAGTADCEAGCEATMAAACPNGPASQEVCVDDCEAQRTGACGAEYDALLACGDGASISCDATYGFPIVDGCDIEQGAFLLCLNG